jgi:hypothetical protein
MLQRGEGLADWTKHHTQEIKESVHMSLIDHPISQRSLDMSTMWTPVIAAEVKETTTPSSVDWVVKLAFFVLVPYGEFISLVMTSIWFWYRCLEKGTSSIDWAQLSKFYVKTETESSLRNVVFLNG